MTPDTPTFFADITTQAAPAPADSIISRALLTTPAVRTVLFSFAPGQQLSDHTASRPAILHVLSGTGTLSALGQTHPAQPGTWLYLPANTPHAVHADSDLVLLLLLLGE